MNKPPTRMLLLTCLMSYSNPGVRAVFGDRLRALGKDLEKTGSGIIGVQDDEEGDSAEED